MEDKIDRRFSVEPMPTGLRRLLADFLDYDEDPLQA